MEAVLEQISLQQKETWNKFSSGWGKWNDLTMNFIKPMGDDIIRLLNPQGNELVLDVASGTGEPGLSIAKLLNGGNVISADISEGMLKYANENAIKQGIKNFETKLCDASDLPFFDNTFDLISCRFGFMFFPDMLLAAREMVRVLKPGGRIATSVWGIPEKNLWVTAIMGPISNNIKLPPKPKEAPGIFRCAQPGLVKDIFEQAGLKNVSEIEVKSNLNAETFINYWNYMTDVVAPAVEALSKADENTVANIKCEVYSLLKRKFPVGNISLEGSAVSIYGEK